MNKSDVTKAHCNQCAGQRNHHVKYAHTKEWSERFDDGSGGIWGSDRFELLECAGCESITVRHTKIFSEECDDHGRPAPSIMYYPAAEFRRKPRWAEGAPLVSGTTIFFLNLPEFVTRYIREIYTALHNNCRSLAAMGVRALLESMIIEKVGDQNSFKANLAAFENNGYIAPKHREVVEAVLEVGHASIHRGFAPSQQDITTVLDITEALIETLYVSGHQAELLRKRTPKRPGKSGKGSAG